MNRFGIVWCVILVTAAGAVAEPLEYERRTPIVDVVEKVSPSVVAIRTDVRRTVAVTPIENLWFGLRGLGERFLQEEVFTSAGSGIIVDDKGTVVTNAHVVEDANRLTGTTSDGEVHNLVLVGVDTDFDIAILQMDQAENPNPKVYPPLDWGRTTDLMIGETVVVMGSALSFENSVSTGVVSAVERTINVPNRNKPYFAMIQTDAAINRGNSGGPLTNIRGELIGITTLIATEGGGSDGIGFAIPIERMKQVYQEFIEGIVSLEERLGIEYVSQKSVEDIDPSQVRRLGLNRNRIEGLIAASLDPNGLGAANGLRKGDLVIELDGRPTTKLDQFQRALEEHAMGQPLAVGVLRYDPTANQVNRETITIPTEQDMSPVSRIEAKDSWFGFDVRGINNEIADRLAVALDDGVVVRSVEAGSAAAKSGIEPGDIIVSVNRLPVQTLGDFRRLRHSLQGAEQVEIQIRRGNQYGVLQLSDSSTPPVNRRILKGS